MDPAVLAEGNSFADPVTWINFGALGLIVVGLITGWLWTKPSVDRLVAEKDRAVQERVQADQQRDAMAQVLQDKLLPVVGDFISTTRALLPILQELQQMQQLLPLLRDLARTQGGIVRVPPPDHPRRRSTD